jgi:hypothetical protein
VLARLGLVLDVGMRLPLGLLPVLSELPEMLGLTARCAGLDVIFADKRFSTMGTDSDRSIVGRGQVC